MGKRSVGVGVWLAFGALVLVAMAPKEIWIWLGVIGVSVLIAYLAIKHPSKKGRHDTHQHEPTQAGLIAKSEPQRSARRPAPSPADRPRTAPEHPPVKNPGPLPERSATRQATIDANRECAQALRDKFYPIPSGTNEKTSAPVQLTASPTTLQPTPPPRVSERAIAPSSPPALSSPSSTTVVSAPNSERTSGDSMRLLQGSRETERMYSATEITKPPVTHVLPAAPAGFGDGRWVPPGESIEVAGVNLPGGMLYVGGRLKALNGGTEPCLISAQHTVARVGNYRTRQMGYWPSYAEASPEERRAYLNWLSEGRSNPDCDIGYVFLFFYGLERRVIVDSRDDPAARSDWPAIIAELQRLLATYGKKSGSFNRYAGELLGWIELDGKSSRLYKQPIPDFPRTYELPPYLRLALGQAAVDRAPLPTQLALAWLRLSPECHLRTAATRCPNEFEHLFAQRYGWSDQSPPSHFRV